MLNTLSKEERPIVACVVMLQSVCLLVLNYHGGYLNVQTLNAITWCGSVLKATNCHIIHFLCPLVLGFILLCKLVATTYVQFSKHQIST